MYFRKHNRHKVQLKHLKGRDRHHFFRARSLGGSDTIDNLLLMDIERHRSWHGLFGLKSAEQALALLQRVVRAKARQKEET